MSFILVPLNGEQVQVNGWNWRPTLEVLHRENVITLHGGVDRTKDKRDEARRKNPGRWELTDRPKIEVIFTPQLESQEADVNDLYSADYEWLATFRGFCKVSGGFQVN